MEAAHPSYARRWLVCEGSPPLLFTENETNTQLLYGVENRTPYVKDGIDNYLVHGQCDAVNPDEVGTKAAAHYRRNIAPGESVILRLRFTSQQPTPGMLEEPFEKVFNQRIAEADEFYAKIIPRSLSADARNVQRQALAGMLWSKQFYHYDVHVWLEGDPAFPPPPAERTQGRNHEWKFLYNADVISVPDKWEYPWYASWDLAFHCVALALVDPDFAKEQLILLLREWYMHPNGQLPAYEWTLQRRQPAGPCLGGMARLQDRKAAPGQGRSRVFGEGLSQAAPELYLVGQPQGPRRNECF